MKLDSLEDLHFPWLPHQLQVNFKVRTEAPLLLFLCALSHCCAESASSTSVLPVFLSHSCVHSMIYWRR